MKTKILALFALVLLLFSCNRAKVDRLESEKNDLQLQVEELKTQSNLKDSTINDFFDTFNEIESNLAFIREKEQVLMKQKVGDVELKKDIKDQIIADIKDIKSAMDDNKNKIGVLNRNLKRANINASKFEEMINSLEKRIMDKDEKITRLTENLSNANEALSVLNDLYIESVLENEAKEEELNTAYYAFGTFKELRENNVLTKEGGIIGLGSAKTLKKDFNKGYFKQIDIQQEKSIELYSKKARLITSHPSESYELAMEEEVYHLQIKDAEKFWSASKYLVVVTD